MKPKPNKMGRPCLPKGEAKGSVVRVRLTTDTRSRVETAAKARKVSVSKLIRSALDSYLEG
jgi:hypothetical protein